MRVGGQRHAPPALPPATTFGNRCTAGLEGRGKLAPPPGFDLLIVQPVASHSNDYNINLYFLKKFPLSMSVTLWAGLAQSV
jgi:hypothetical protein